MYQQDDISMYNREEIDNELKVDTQASDENYILDPFVDDSNSSTIVVELPPEKQNSFRPPPLLRKSTNTSVVHGGVYFWDRFNEDHLSLLSNSETTSQDPVDETPPRCSRFDSARAWLARVRRQKAFTTSVIWGARMGWGATFTGLVCVLIHRFSESIDRRVGPFCFLLPLMGVLATGKTFGDTYALCKDGIIGAVHGILLGIIQGLLILLMFPADSSTPDGELDGNYANRVGMVVISLFFTVSLLSIWKMPPMLRKIICATYLFVIFVCLPPGTTLEDVAINTAVIGIVFMAGAGLTLIAHAFSPRNSSLSIANKSLVGILKLISQLNTLLFHSYLTIDENSLTSAALIDLRVGSRLLLDKLRRELAHANRVVANAALTFPYLYVKRDVHTAVEFIRIASQTVNCFAGIRRGLTLHPIFTATPTIWSGLRTAMIPEIRSISTSLETTIAAMIRTLKSSQRPDIDQILADSRDASLNLETCYFNARRQVFYDPDMVDIQIGHLHPHHLFLFHIFQLGTVLSQLTQATQDVQFTRQSCFVEDLHRFYTDYFPLHQLHQIFIDFLKDIPARKDAIIRSFILGFIIVLLGLFRFIPSAYALFPRAAWAPVTAVFIADVHSTASTYRTGFQRLVGTVIGGTVGFLAAWIALGLPELSLFFAFITGWVSGYARASPRWAYAGVVSAFTSQVVIFSGIYTTTGPELTSVVFQRIVLTLIGVLGTSLGSLLWPFSARKALVQTGVSNINKLKEFVAIIFNPFTRHPHFTTDAEYRRQFASSHSVIQEAIAAQTLLVSMAEEEPVLWRNEFDPKIWHSFISAQTAFFSCMADLKPFLTVESPSFQLFTEWTGPEIDELREELSLILENLTPLVSQTNQRKTINVLPIRLPCITLATPIQLRESCLKLYEKFSAMLFNHRNLVLQGKATVLTNAQLLPISAFVTSLSELVSSTEQLWQSIYEVYSRNRFAL